MDFADPAYRRKMALLVKRVCQKHGLGERSSDALLTKDIGKLRKTPASVVVPEPQALLFA